MTKQQLLSFSTFSLSFRHFSNRRVSGVEAVRGLIKLRWHICFRFCMQVPYFRKKKQKKHTTTDLLGMLGKSDLVVGFWRVACVNFKTSFIFTFSSVHADLWKGFSRHLPGKWDLLITGTVFCKKNHRLLLIQTEDQRFLNQSQYPSATRQNSQGWIAFSLLISPVKLTDLSLNSSVRIAALTSQWNLNQERLNMALASQSGPQ